MYRHILAVSIGSALLAVPTISRGTTADDLCAPTQNPCRVTSSVTVDAGSTIDLGGRDLIVTGSGVLDVGRGAMVIRARNVTIESGGSLRARGSNAIPGGQITVQAQRVDVSGAIEAFGAPGGSVEIEASGAVTVSGRIDADFRGSGLDGGSITVIGDTVNISGTVTATGSNEGLGGEAEIRAFGNLSITGTVDVRGGDGGDITLAAGDEEGTGNLTIGAGGRVQADARVGGGLAGSIEISVAGDGSTTGHLIQDGMLSATGPGGTEDSGGGAGGSLDIELDGDWRGTNPAAAVALTGGGPDGEGGEIDASVAGAFTTVAKIDASAAGIETSGGDVFISVIGPVSILSDVDASGGGFDGGEILIESAAGSIEVLDTARVRADATNGGFGGAVELDAGVSGEPGATVRIEGRVSAVGGGIFDGFAGDGGDVTLSATSDVTIDAEIDVAGGGGGGTGGTIDIATDTGQITVNARIDARGNGVDGGGGIAQVTSTGADLVVNGSIETDAGTADDPGGRTRIEACNVTIARNGLVSSLGTAGTQDRQGTNVIVAREDTIIEGTLRAGLRNEIHFRPGFESPRLGTEQPPAIRIPDETIPACGASITPTPTPGPTGCPGDCNGDGSVAINELVLGVNIALGRQPASACASFDANGDGSVAINELILGVNAALRGCPAG